jgi:cytochrome c
MSLANEGDAPFGGTEADWARFRGVLRLSRFKLVGNELDLGTEQQIIDVPADRGICCHLREIEDAASKITVQRPGTPSTSSD